MSEGSFHTPEPWTVTWDPDQYGHYILDEARKEQEEWVFEGEDEGFDQRQEIANLHDVGNSRLMQASPGMFKALKAIADMQVDETTDHAQLSALCIAIAKEEINKLIKEIKERANYEL